MMLPTGSCVGSDKALVRPANWLLNPFAMLLRGRPVIRGIEGSVSVGRTVGNANDTVGKAESIGASRFPPRM